MSLSAETRFVFHSVGQGLFYTGEIEFKEDNKTKKKFVFVYDCGGSGKKQIESQIKNFKSDLKSSTIDMLVISHFHKDHINGLKCLLEEFNIKRVFLPYLSPIDRLIVAIKVKNVNKFFYSFISNPYRFLLEKGVGKVIVIIPGEPDKKGLLPEPSDNFELNYNELIINNNEVNKKIDEIRNLDDERIIFIKHNGFIKIKNWCFKFYNRMVKDNKVNDLIKCIKKVIPNFNISNSLEKIILNEKMRYKVKECYEQTFGKEKINETSLVMMHQPINEKQISFKLYPIFYNCFIDFYYDLNLKFYNNFKKSKYSVESIFSHSLTGDIDLNESYDDIKSHFSAFMNKVLVNQIPHHGSNNNWNEAFLRDFNSIFNIASARRLGKHPSKKVFEKIIEKGCIPFHVNEDVWFTIKATIHW